MVYASIFCCFFFHLFFTVNSACEWECLDIFSIWNRVLSKRQKILLAGLVDVSDVWMDVVLRNPKILSMPSAEDVTAIVDALLRQGECTEKEAMGGHVLLS